MTDNDALAVVGTIVYAILAFLVGLWGLGLIFVGLLVLEVMALLPATWPPPSSPAETQVDRIETAARSIERSQYSD